MIDLPKSVFQAVGQGQKDAAELIELVHETDRDHVWKVLSSWTTTRLAVCLIILAAAHDCDVVLAEKLAWTLDVADSLDRLDECGKVA